MTQKKSASVLAGVFFMALVSGPGCLEVDDEMCLADHDCESGHCNNGVCAPIGDTETGTVDTGTADTAIAPGDSDSAACQTPDYAGDRPRCFGGDDNHCCHDATQREDVWWHTAHTQGVTCTDADLSNCAIGQTCSEGLCTCVSSCDCRSGLCAADGVCLPDPCQGYYVCTCWGGDAWWSADAQLTPAMQAEAHDEFCRTTFETDTDGAATVQYYEFVAPAR